ncbi:MAG: DUF11 domain-containing protein, partial [Oscillochloris sp.]|nr:DUF11 domain-containing protein [Oscillochloris sp.]
MECNHLPGTVTYTLDIRNIGDAPAAGAYVVDTLSDYVDSVSYISNGGTVFVGAGGYVSRVGYSAAASNNLVVVNGANSLFTRLGPFILGDA